MGYLLDSNACIRALKQPGSSVGQRILSIPATEIHLCTIVYSELYYGVCKSTQFERNLARLEIFCRAFVCLPFDLTSAKIAGQIRAQLFTQGTPIGSNDILIAAIAIANNLTLITHNIAEFSRIDGLIYEDWE